MTAADRIGVSLDEFAFCVLVQSHTVACQAFGQVVINAIKRSHPTTWIETICGCFSHRLFCKLKAQLEADCCLTDIYAICKVMTVRLNDVVRFCGGILRDPKEKENFSFQVYGVEESRNWAFHGEGVSAEEVCASIKSMISISNTLRCGHHVQAKLQDFLTQLSDAKKNITEPFCCSVEACILAKMFLYRSFAEVEEKFAEFFRNGVKSVTAFFPGIEKRNDKGKEDIQDLMKRIRKGGSSRELAEKLPCFSKEIGKKLEGGALCKNIEQMRNNLAHFRHTSLQDVEKTLNHCHVLLNAFDLYCQETASAIKDLRALTDQKVRAISCAVFLTDSMRFSGSRQWLSRPACPYFVGREREMVCIRQALGRCDLRNSVVVLSGAAGIGKSYLAAKLAFDLRTLFPRQLWISCSTIGDFVKDVPASILSRFATETPSTNSNSGGLSHQSGNSTDCRAWECLTILDDVTLHTIRLVCDLAENINHFFLITTRSYAVKLRLQAEIKSSFVVHVSMQPFSVNESCQLILRRAVKVCPEDLNRWKDVVSTHLANNPLCVGIFASWLAANFVTKHPLVHCDQRIGSPPSIKEKWPNIEEEFGDRFHRRGLSGVVQLAINSLQSNPQAYFLLGMICCLNKETIPWDLLCQSKVNCDIPMSFVTNVGSSDFQRISHAANNLLLDLLPVGEERSILCRHLLEEVGLISWNETSNAVHIHGITLSITRESYKRGLRRFLAIHFGKVLDLKRGKGDRVLENVTGSFILPFEFVVFVQTTRLAKKTSSKINSEFEKGLRLQKPTLEVLQVVFELLKAQQHTFQSILGSTSGFSTDIKATCEGFATELGRHVLSSKGRCLLSSEDFQLLRMFLSVESHIRCELELMEIVGQGSATAVLHFLRQSLTNCLRLGHFQNQEDTCDVDMALSPAEIFVSTQNRVAEPHPQQACAQHLQLNAPPTISDRINSYMKPSNATKKVIPMWDLHVMKKGNRRHLVSSLIFHETRK